MANPAYFDYAATTPVDPLVVQKMLGCLNFAGDFGNATSQHFYGRAASQHIESARQEIARTIHAEPREIIFTSGATEANNLAIKGIAFAYQDQGKHIITCQTEHKSILEPCHFLEQLGFEITYLPVQRNGLIELDRIKAAIRKETILISIMQVNNEIGTIQDLTAIAQLAKQHNIVFHSDAAQSIAKLKVDVKALGLDAMSLSAHKAYGPKGIGALYIKRPLIKLKALLHGGGHEYGLRSGTLATHQIIGMAEAFSLADKNVAQEYAHIAQLKSMLWQGIKHLPGVSLNGDFEHCIAHILNVCFSSINGDVLFNALQPSIAVSQGAACDSAQTEPSHVLKSLGLSRDLIESSIRFSIGRYSTKQDIETAIQAITSIVLS
jgi:cysteine desulfurase